jgi:hypothetical protein
MPSMDLEKVKIHRKRHYEKNKEAIKARVNELRRLNKQKWWEYKSTLACESCGAAHPAIIDFHHPPEAVKDKQDINQLVARNRYGQAYKEIKRCKVLCANCHRILHFNEHQALKALRRAQEASNDNDSG